MGKSSVTGYRRLHNTKLNEENEEALQALRRMRKILGKVDMKRVIEHIREDREYR